ncbi:MAG: acyl--CoA ligase [Acidimicrobiaceae bacterium]|nr:acyl--CoA ligase [Acidimicrobiaceae bacterium]MYH00224.1 acyl--CoA ligase [Acidimicrobiaceae bacterium]MYL04326.1 acyl--CoA ligase [Acidimicrobiaceae bacterium]
MLAATIERAAREFGSRAAFVTPSGGPVSFEQLEFAGREAAAGLRERGLGEGSVVGLVLPSGVDYLAVYLGAARIGAVTAGINPLLTQAEVTACLDTLDADLVVVDPRLAHLVERRAAPRCETLEPGPDPAAAGGSIRSPSRASQRPAPADDDERPVCICFTSGSTGAPKPAWFASRQLRAVAAIDAGSAWGGGHGISSTHFAHVGFMTKLPWMLACGRTTHLLERWSAGAALELVARHRMAAVNGVAPQIALMVRHELSKKLDFSAVRAVVAGGGPSSPELVRAARDRFGAPYSIRYSSTESGGVGLATALEADDDEACHSVGRPRDGVEAEIRDPDGVRLDAGETGELWLRSPAVMSGYWRDPDGSAEALVDGWLRTGDLATVDGRGLYRLAGRTAEMYIRGGYNVYPIEVEAVLEAHPDVAEAVVVGRPDPVMGEIGLAVVVIRAGVSPPTLEELRAFCSASLARYKLPEALELVDALPRNPSGKIDRRCLA